MSIFVECLGNSAVAFGEPALELKTSDSTKHGLISLCTSMLFSCACVITASIGLIYGVMVVWYTSLEVVDVPT